MEDRRSAFPGKDYEPEEHNILDGPYVRTENEPIHVVHKRYWALLVAAVVIIALFSFYSPASMTGALHCSSDETQFVYATASDNFSRAQAQPLNQAATEILLSYSTSHMLQQEAVFDVQDAIVIYPAEDTNYALYATPEASYIFAVDQNKYRYRVNDDGTFYETLTAAINGTA